MTTKIYFCLIAGCLFLGSAMGQNTYVISSQTNGPNIVGTFEVTSTTSGDGNDYEYTGPTEMGHENQNMFKITRIDITPFPLPPGTIWEWQILDVSDNIEFKATAGGTSQPSAPDANWLYAGSGGGSASGALLPVEFSHFRANSKSGRVELDWGTSSESGNKGFEIQHSTDARQWEVLDFIEGFGTTTAQQNYGYLHEKPAPGNNYYRLRQIDYDGEFDFSEMVTATLPLAKTLEVYPNPTHGTVRVVLPEGPFHEILDLKLTDALGRLVWQTSLSGGAAHEQLELPPTLRAGCYQLSTLIGGVPHQVRIVKQ